jgi:hypothetical protein
MYRRAIFTWIGRNVEFSAADRYDLKPLQVLDSGKGVCNGFCTLFDELAEAAGLDCKVMPRRSKTAAYDARVGVMEELDIKHSDHAWLAVELDDGWKLMDPTWGANGEIGDNDETGLGYCYFGTPPDEFLNRHYPSLIDLNGKPYPDDRFYLSGPKFNYPVWRALDICPPLLKNTHIIDVTDESIVVPKTNIIKLPTETSTVTFGFEVTCPHQDLSKVKFVVWKKGSEVAQGTC